MSPCVHEKDCDSSRPFYVGNRPQFPHSRFGYAPSYCRYCYSYQEGVKLVSPESKVIIKNVSLDQYQQLQGQVQYLKNTLQTHISDKKKNTKKQYTV